MSYTQKQLFTGLLSICKVLFIILRTLYLLINDPISRAKSLLQLQAYSRGQEKPCKGKLTTHRFARDFHGIYMSQGASTSLVHNKLRVQHCDSDNIFLFYSGSVLLFWFCPSPNRWVNYKAATGMAQKHSLHASLISSISLLFMRSFQSGPSIGKNLAYSCKADVEEWERDFVWEPSLRNIIAIIILLLIVESYN